jgi:hypothetical protein
MKAPKVSFQIIVDAPNIFLSVTPDGKKMRANITELDSSQIKRIVEAIEDAGPEAYSYLKKLVGE